MLVAEMNTRILKSVYIGFNPMTKSHLAKREP